MIGADEYTGGVELAHFTILLVLLRYNKLPHSGIRIGTILHNSNSIELSILEIEELLRGDVRKQRL